MLGTLISFQVVIGDLAPALVSSTLGIVVSMNSAPINTLLFMFSSFDFSQPLNSFLEIMVTCSFLSYEKRVIAHEKLLLFPQQTGSLRTFLMCLSSLGVVPLALMRNISSLANMNAMSMGFYSIFVLVVSIHFCDAVF